MQAGRLRNRIVIEQPVETRSSVGGVITTWSTFARLWAEKREPRGREFFAAAAVQSELTAVFVTRACAGITSKMRIVFKGDVYQIKAPPTDPDDRRREMNILCTRLATEKATADAFLLQGNLGYLLLQDGSALTLQV